MTDASPAPRYQRIPAGTVDPSEPGQPWWKYRPMEVPAPPHPERGRGNGGTRESDASDGDSADDADGESERERRAREIIQTHTRSGVGAFALGAALLGATAIWTQLNGVRHGRWLLPVAALFFAVAAAQRITRSHPDEPWVGRILVLGTAVKLAAAYARYFNLERNYNGIGDAADYDEHGRGFAQAWLHGGVEPYLTDLRKTNFVRKFTGYVYYTVGPDLMAGTFAFALLALIGTYFWYRATADSVPIVDKRLYMIFLLFAPSVAFWPAIVGKEALMQLGLGTLALGASMLFRRQLVRGLLVALPGGWLTWVVRPHLLALVAIAAAVAYFGGRVGARGWGLISRPVGLIVMAFLVAFTVGQAANFLGINSLSLSSIQQELDETTEQTAQGGSEFTHGNNSLNPIYLPANFTTVFVRPFPWEAHGLQLLASAEGLALAGLLVARFTSVRISLARSREFPFLLFVWCLVGLYAIAFSSFANFGILVRQRSLVLPAILVLVAVDPVRDRLRRGEKLDEPRHPVIGAA